MKRRVLTIVLMSMGLVNYSQNCDCSELLKYGIYDHFSSTENIDNYNEIQKAVRNSSSRGSGGSQGGNVGYAGFSLGYSESETKMLKKITSNKLLEKSDVEELKKESASFVSSEMMSAYRECMQLCEKSGLQSKSDFPTDGRFESISFTLKYKKPEFVPKVPVLKEISIGPDPNCYECKGDLIDLANNKEQLKESETYKMTCVRKISDKAFRLSGTNSMIYAKGAHISIVTDMGDYDLRIPPLYAKNPEFEKRMGEIVASVLTEEKFIEINGNDWMLANGAEAPSTSEYRKYIDKELPHMNGKLPNLCGVFLRGFNNGQSINPDNNKLGSLQPDAFQGHFHESTGKIITRDKGNKNVGADKDFLKTLQPDQTIVGTAISDNLNGNPRIAIETRPKNVTVNYFIKIN